MENKALAVIIARGGSKRIPKKNIKDFCGKPIISYSIEAALKSGLFSEVMVSTDSIEIAEIAKKYGAAVPFMRSAKTAGDYAPMSEALVEVLEEYKKRNQHFKYMCCIFPTAPFVTPNKLQEAMNLMEEHNPIEVMPVVQFSHPPQRCFVIDEQNNMKYKYEEYIQKRTQDLEKQYHDAGQFYIYHVDKYLKAGGKVSGNIMPIIVSDLEVQDIDNKDDWKIAELKYKLMKEGFN